MSKDKDSQLIWENYSNKFRGPGSPGVNLARGYLLQALELIEDDDVHLCADAEALETTIDVCKKAIGALSHDNHEVHEANKKPDGDGDGVPDWADKRHGEDDHEEVDENYAQTIADEEKFLETAYKYYGDMEESELKYHHHVLEELLEMDELTRREYQGQGPQRDR